MATVTKFANANAIVTTGWTSPTNAYADDSVYATAAPAKNASVTSDYGFPAFTTSDIPAGSTIVSVKAEIQYKASTTSSTGATIGLQLNNNGTLLGSEQSGAMALADTLLTHTVTTGITQANLQTANFVKARVAGKRTSSNTTITWSIDYATLTVTYNPPAYKDAATRFKLRGTGFMDAAGRFIVLERRVNFRLRQASGSALRAALSPYDNDALRGMLGRAFRDVGARFNLAAAAGTTTYRDVATRLNLRATAYRDARLRLRVQSAAMYRDASTRFRLTTAATFKDAAARFRLQAQSYRNVALRLRIASQATYKDVGSRLRLLDTNYADHATRFLLQGAAFKNAALRFRLVATGYRDASARFVLLSASTAFKNAAVRFKLASAAAYRDATARLRLRSANTYRDASARLRVASQATWRDAASRLRLSALAVRDVRARYRLQANNTRDVATRFIVQTPPPVVARTRRTWQGTRTGDRAILF